MTQTMDLLARIEAAAVRGWPAAETSLIDGWLARTTSGGSVRANTVAALAFHGGDLGQAIERVIAFYRARGAPARFTISDVSEPAGLDAELERRGFSRSADHITMAKPVTTAPAPRLTVRASETTDAVWYSVYLQGLSESRRAMAPSLVERVPGPRMFFTALRDGEAIGSGLSVLDGELASVQCMAALVAARRTGAATAVLAAIEAHALANGKRWLYLQTDDDNRPAVALYEKYGFSLAGRYHTRDLTT